MLYCTWLPGKQRREQAAVADKEERPRDKTGSAKTAQVVVDRICSGVPSGIAVAIAISLAVELPCSDARKKQGSCGEAC